jgi:ferredoxin-NADP reductase
VLAGWLDAWTAESIRAAGALAPLFGAGAGDASETIGSLEMVPVLSEPAPVWAGETGLVTDAVNRRLPRLSGYDAHLCGPPAMIDAAVELVARRGVRPRNVYFDAFVPTG